MEFELIAVYQSGPKEGNCHIYIKSIDLHIRGIYWSINEKASISTRTMMRTVTEKEKKVCFPMFTLGDREKNKQFFNRLSKSILDWFSQGKPVIRIHEHKKQFIKKPNFHGKTKRNFRAS